MGTSVPGCLCLDFTWLPTCAHCVHGASTWSRPISPILLVYQWTPSVENQSRLVLRLTRVWQRKRRFHHFSGLIRIQVYMRDRVPMDKALPVNQTHNDLRVTEAAVDHVCDRAEIGDPGTLTCDDGAPISVIARQVQSD